MRTPRHALPEPPARRPDASARWVVLLPLLAASCSTAPAPPGEALGSAEQAVTCHTFYRGGVGTVEDATVSVDPTDPAQASSNTGSSLTLTTGKFGTSARSALLRFDVAAIPSQAVVTSASLQLFKSSSLGAGPLNVHGVLAPWAEGTVTHSAISAAFDPAVVASAVPSAFPNGSVMPIDITSIVAAWVADAASNHGVVLEKQDSGGRATFGASEAGAPHPRPKLTVCYAPPSCGDGVQGGAETGVDCGGSCPPCGACVGVTCTASDTCHVAGVCNPSTGQCSSPVAPFGTACDDGNACTQIDQCQTGVCVGSGSITCTAVDACHAAGACDPATGACSSPPLADDSPCDDADACTLVDACQSGLCVGSSSVDGTACATGLAGACATGIVACSAGASSCVPDADPAAEVCNGIDDDCDGVIDEGCVSCAGSDCQSCATIHAAAPAAPDGVYTVDPDGAGPGAAFDAYCDMTTDGGGWSLMATLHTSTIHTPSALFNPWSDDWWTVQHGAATDPTAAFTNHDVRRWKALVSAGMLLRTTTPGSAVKRYHFGMQPADWDLWNQSRSVDSVNVIGPFNLANVLVSTSLSLASPVMARLNGHWFNGQFYMGTAPGAGDADSEGLGARFHTGSNAAPQFSFAGDARVDAPWNLWIRENPTCSDGVQNGSEGGVDCGGSCGACPTCSDGVQNGAETGPDCGGACAACPLVTCESILAGAPGSADGVYTVDPDGPGGSAPFAAYCDMTTDGGGWGLMATLSTLATSSPAPSWPWVDGWWTGDHGAPTSLSTAFSNRDARLWKPLVDADFVMRISSPAAAIKRYHFGFTPADWDLWSGGRTVSGVNVVGPFNLANVLVSTSPSLAGGTMARLNGHWSSGYFYVGTAPGAGDGDSEGLGARFHVASNAPPQFGYCGGVRQSALWHLWVR